MEMSIYQTARLEVKEEALEICQHAISLFVEYVRDHEPGTLSYISLQESENPTKFLHVFIFRDAKAKDVHTNSIAVNRFTSTLYPNLKAPVEFSEYQVLASTGPR
jgi:quinol monooxygenase YgiN